MGFFSKLKESLKKTKEAISYKLNKLFTGGVLNDEFYDELEMIMLSADIGAGATETILEQLRDVVDEKHIRKPTRCERNCAVLWWRYWRTTPLPITNIRLL